MVLPLIVFGQSIVGVERKHLARRQHEVVVPSRRTSAPPDTTRCARPTRRRFRTPRAFRRSRPRMRFRLHQRALGRIVVEVLERDAGLPGAQRAPVLPDLFDREVGPGFFDDAAQGFEHLERGPAQVEHARLERDGAAEVARPSDARAFEIAPQVAREVRRILAVGQRQARVVARLHRQQHGEVRHGARHRALHAHIGVEHVQALRRHAAVRRPEAEHVVPRRRDCAASRRDRCRRRRAACAARLRRRRRRSIHPTFSIGRRRSACGRTRRCRCSSRARIPACWSCRSRCRRPASCARPRWRRPPARNP